jgi:hypothetical protein
MKNRFKMDYFGLVGTRFSYGFLFGFFGLFLRTFFGLFLRTFFGLFIRLFFGIFLGLFFDIKGLKGGRKKKWK